MPRQYDNPTDVDTNVRFGAREIQNDFQDQPIDVVKTGTAGG